jgi:molybdopterin converting factor small subunit
MKIRLRLFAILRERSGISETEIELADGATVGIALEEAGRRIAGIKDLLPRTAAAVNLTYAGKEDRLRDGDELALIPPVSGG